MVLEILKRKTGIRNDRCSEWEKIAHKKEKICYTFKEYPRITVKLKNIYDY